MRNGFYIIDGIYNPDTKELELGVQKIASDYLVIDINNLSNVMLGIDTWDGIWVKTGIYNQTLPYKYQLAIADNEDNDKNYNDIITLQPFYHTQAEAELALKNLKLRLAELINDKKEIIKNTYTF